MKILIIIAIIIFLVYIFWNLYENTKNEERCNATICNNKNWEELNKCKESSKYTECLDIEIYD